MWYSDLFVNIGCKQVVVNNKRNLITNPMFWNPQPTTASYASQATTQLLKLNKLLDRFNRKHIYAKLLHKGPAGFRTHLNLFFKLICAIF